jgi:hypothetical protein
MDSWPTAGWFVMPKTIGNYGNHGSPDVVGKPGFLVAQEVPTPPERSQRPVGGSDLGFRLGGSPV